MRATAIGHAGILVEAGSRTVLCDPWFLPAFFGSWFVFPRNDQLDSELMARIDRPDFLYVSHLHADHLDEPWLTNHVDRRATVLLPDYPTGELERTLRSLGFDRFLHTTDGASMELDGFSVSIHVETSITDGPGGDSAIVISDATGRLLNQNDCRPHDLDTIVGDRAIDLHWLQYSGAIWYPMVYDEPDHVKRVQAKAKVDSQFARAIHYVEAVGARIVVPSAGPPCFLDPDLFGMNMIDGDEISIFPDQTIFIERLIQRGITTGQLTIPGTTFGVMPDSIVVSQPVSAPVLDAIFSDKRAGLERYQRDWSGWMDDHRKTWHSPRPGLTERLAAWWEPLLAMAPTLRSMIGADLLIRADGEEILVDFGNGTVGQYHGEPVGFRFDIPRPLIETVVDRRAIDWSNALLLSCRFRAWRSGVFNEFLYNFLKSLSPERLERAEAEAWSKAIASGRRLVPDEEIDLGGYVMERFCPHRQADLSRFATIDGTTLTCTLHGWQFDLETGQCLTASDRHLRVRRAD